MASVGCVPDAALRLRGAGGVVDHLLLYQHTRPWAFATRNDEMASLALSRSQAQRTKFVRNGKLTNVREYIDTQALARASEMDASPKP